MTASTLTGDQLLVGMSKYVDDYFAGTTTSAGSSTGDTIVDTALEVYGDNRLVGHWIRITNAGGTQYEVRRVTANVQATGSVTVAPVFSAQIATSSTYELHAYEPRKKFQALDAARLPAAEWVFRLVYDETLTTDGVSREFKIPSTMRRGPALVYVEHPTNAVLQTTNFIPSPQSDTIMVDWTASNATLADFTRNDNDRLIPKYGWAATKVSVAASTNGTVTLTVANMDNDITAATGAGRYMTYAHWIYCRVASRVTLKLIDDSGTVDTSAAHQGRGWELLTVSGMVSATNATTLSIRIDVSSAAAAVVLWANNSWFYFGDPEALTSNFYEQTPVRVRRDATNQKFWTRGILPARLQLRLVGRELLTALGTVAATQAAATMEVDETSAEILYAEAAEILFQLERISTANLSQVVERIKMTRDRAPQLRMLWEYDMPEQRVLSPYMRA